MKINKEKKRELNKLVDDRSMTPAEVEKARKAINIIVKEVKKAMAGLPEVSMDRVFKGSFLPLNNSTFTFFILNLKLRTMLYFYANNS
jgi:hypothetical protein